MRRRTLHIPAYTPSAAASMTTIWTGPGDYTWNNAFLSHTIESDDARDNPAGPGLREIEVEGETAIGVESEIVATNGTTPVPLVNEYRGPVQMIGTDAGAKNGAWGNISLKESGITYGYIKAGDNRTMQAIYRIPEGHYGQILNIQPGSPNAGTNIEIWTKRKANPWTLLMPGHIHQRDLNYFNIQNYRLRDGEQLEVKGQDSGSQISCLIQLLVVKR